MSRPLRIEFKGAYYHVMNRGAGRQAIFAHDDHRHLFLELLHESQAMFRAAIHAYCLMDNHYHLLVSTPDGNLNRIMRHISGVYTQRYNRSEKTDGPLFRGRYKAILVDADAYLLSVSRYIHLNPVSANLIRKAHTYPWSSYRAYIGKTTPPSWLNTEKTLSMVGLRSRQQRYQQFVEDGLDQDTQLFYAKKKCPPILGRSQFVKRMQNRIRPDKEIPEQKQLTTAISLDRLVRLTAKAFNTDKAGLLRTGRGRGHANIARSAAMYLSRSLAGYPLKEIAAYFGLESYGSVSGQLHRFKQALRNNTELFRTVNRLSKIIKEQT